LSWAIFDHLSGTTPFDAAFAAKCGTNITIAEFQCDKLIESSFDERLLCQDSSDTRRALPRGLTL
jgi:hypothetical protein